MHVSRPTSFGVANNSWRIFTYKELHTATNGFSDDYKLGEGGFGSVYWGRTSDGLQVNITYTDTDFKHDKYTIYYMYQCCVGVVS